MVAAAILLLLLALAAGLVGLWQYVSGRSHNEALAERSALDQVEARSSTLLGRLDVRLRRTKVGHRLALRLLAAGVGLNVAQFVLIDAAVLLVCYLGIGAAFGHVLGFLLGVAAVAGSVTFLRYKQNQRAEIFIGQLPELARVLSNAASAGLALRTAIAMAADELDDPAKAELRFTADALAVGHSVDEALNELNERLPSRELGVLVTTLVIQHRSGGALVTALQNISETLDARKDVRREVRTTMAGAVYTSYLVAIMGLGTLLLLDLINPNTLNNMFGSPAGLIAVALSAGFYVVGFTLIRRITRVEV
jgi:tight adherence protein B